MPLWELTHNPWIILQTVSIANQKKELVEYMKQDSQKALVLMGAYSRSSISRLFIKSMAESVIHKTKFIIYYP